MQLDTRTELLYNNSCAKLCMCVCMCVSDYVHMCSFCRCLLCVFVHAGTHSHVCAYFRYLSVSVSSNPRIELWACSIICGFFGRLWGSELRSLCWCSKVSILRATLTTLGQGMWFTNMSFLYFKIPHFQHWQSIWWARALSRQFSKETYG